MTHITVALKTDLMKMRTPSYHKSKVKPRRERTRMNKVLQQPPSSQRGSSEERE